MIKQNWLISEEDKSRILSMHKKATANFYLVEKQIINEIIEEETKTIDFNFNYPSGWWSENTPGLVESLNNKVNEIYNFIVKNKGNKINIVVEVGESLVPNYNGEDKNIEKIKNLKYDERIKYRMPEGQLADYRGGVIKRMLDKIFNGYLQKRLIVEKPEITPTKVIGKTQFTANDNPNDKKYTDEQYVKFILTVKGDDNKECEINIVLEINYDKESNAKGINHECNAALFMIDANGIPLKTKDGTDADMNNGSKPWPPKNDKGKPEVDTKEFINTNTGKPGGYRYNQFIITPDIGKQIMTKSPDGNITIRSKCLTPSDEDRGKGKGKCHIEVPHVLIKDMSGKILNNFFPNTSEGVICILDKCGKFIK